MRRVETPFDQVSGMPLLIAPDPQERVLSILRGEESNIGTKGQPIVNINHNVHPRAEVIAGGEGGEALLNGRGQHVLVDDHNAYHDLYVRTRLPKTPAAKCARLVLCQAKFIPQEVLVVRGSNIGIARASDAEHKRLRFSGEVFVIAPDVVTGFMRSFLLSQPIEGITATQVDRFLALDPRSHGDAKEQEALVDLFLSRLAAAAVAPVEGAYRFGRKRGLLAPNVPPHPADFMKSLVAPTRNTVSIIADRFIKRLAAERKGRPAVAHLGGLALA